MSEFTQSPSPDSLSVVIATDGRDAIVNETVASLLRQASSFPIEILVVNHGRGKEFFFDAEDHAQGKHPVKLLNVPGKSPGAARNTGASEAVNRILLFLDDDLRPESTDFLSAHGSAHRSDARPRAVTGPVYGEDDTRLLASQAVGGWWRMSGPLLDAVDRFDLSNVSLPRNLVPDWQQAGFHEDPLLDGAEGLEMAWRLRLKMSLAVEVRPDLAVRRATTRPFEHLIRRQFLLGEAAERFAQLHPSAPRNLFEDAAVLDALRAPLATDQTLLGDYVATLEGIFAWSRIEAKQGRLGEQAWHEELIQAVFQLARHQGRMIAAVEPLSNLEYAHETALGLFFHRVQGTLDASFERGTPFAYVQAPQPQPPIVHKTMAQRISKIVVKGYQSLTRSRPR